MVVVAATVTSISMFVPPADAIEVPNTLSSVAVGSSTAEGLDAEAMGDHVPPAEELDAAFSCLNPTAKPDAVQTILLVPGLAADPIQSFSWNLLPQLDAAGYDMCWITPPESGRADLTQTALYVAHAINRAQERLDSRIAVLGHSAGPPAAMWALRYNPDAAAQVEDFISIAGANHGTTLVEPVCAAIGACPVIAWQMHPQSQFIRTINASRLPESIDVTSIYSLTDPGIQPAAYTSSIEGASNIALQDVCPTHLAGHISVLLTNATYRLVMDALSHDGPADPARIGRENCADYIAPGVELDKTLTAAPALLEAIAVLGEPRYTSEPPLPSYAQNDIEPAEAAEIAEGSAGRITMSGETITDAVIGSAVDGAVGSATSSR